MPVEGYSFKYPDYFDILSVESGAAVFIRNRKIEDIVPLSDYQYVGLPIMDEKGFALKIGVKAELDAYLKEYQGLQKSEKVEFHDKWSRFETYRRIVCTDNFWMI